MAWFDVGAGLAKMGEQVAQTTSVAMLEQMKAQNEEARIKLADELATVRESKGRQEAHGLDMAKLDKTQTFTAGESKLDRENRLATTNISAGASIASARIHADSTDRQIASREKESAADRVLREREINDRFIQGREADRRHAEDSSALDEYRRNSLKAQLAGHAQIKINDDGTASTVNAATGQVTPLLGPDNQPVKFRDTDKAKAQHELLLATRAQYDSTTTQYQIEMRQAQAELKAAQESGGRIDGEKDPGVIAAKKLVEDVKAKFEPKITQLDQRLNSLSQSLVDQAGIKAPKPAGAGGPNPADFDRGAKNGNSGAGKPGAPNAAWFDGAY